MTSTKPVIREYDIPIEPKVPIPRELPAGPEPAPSFAPMREVPKEVPVERP